MDLDAHDLVTDRAFCREQVFKTDRLFRISHLFTPQELTDRVLSIHALFSAVEDSVCGISENDIARRRLAWWYEELIMKDPAERSHPICRLLDASGARQCIQDRWIKDLLDVSLAGLDAAPPPQEAVLADMCAALYKPRLQIELAVQDALKPQEACLNVLAIRGGLLQLIRESSRVGVRQYDWLPLNLLARHGLTSIQLASEPDSDKACKVMSGVFGGMEDYLSTENGNESGQSRFRIEEQLKPYRHLRVHSTLQSRQLEQLQTCTPAEYGQELRALRLGNLWLAWREARKP